MPGGFEVDMNFYFAPMEGLTDSIYRRTHHRYFPGVDAYYMPFFSPTIHRSLTSREARELPYGDTEGFTAVPQIMTKNTEDFLWAAQQCLDRGYREVNLNLGCPSGTVFSKGKGSGMLRDPGKLERFLDCVYARSPLPISLKTRLGVDDPQEFIRLLDIYNRYPVKLLIVHPRVRRDFYEGPVQMELFQYALNRSRNPLCFNGNLTTRNQLDAFSKTFPGVSSVMVGRGLIGNPALLCAQNAAPDTLEQFCDELLDQYIEAFGGSRNAMFRLKENWRYLLCLFRNTEKLGKQLRKTTDIAQYRAITHEIFHTCSMKPELTPDW